MLGKLTSEWEIIDNKVRFILMVIDGKLVVNKVSDTKNHSNRFLYTSIEKES